MRIGLFADCHAHLSNLRLPVDPFSPRSCDVLLFAGDLASTFAVPPLRALRCPFVGCFGDNEGNRVGLLSGMRIVGRLEEAPVRYETPDGVRFVIVHMLTQLRGWTDPFDVLVYGHTHKPVVRHDESGRLMVNPGEVSGWTFGRPTIALMDTSSMQVELIDLAAPSAETASSKSATHVMPGRDPASAPSRSASGG